MTSAQPSWEEARWRAGIDVDNWLDHSFSRYSLQRPAEFVPSAVWSPGIASPESDELFKRLAVPDGGGAIIAAEQHFRASCADTVLLCENDRIAARWNAPGVDPARPHMLFSIGKSITGILAGTLIEEGRLEPGMQAQSLVPELAGAAIGSATVRHMLDMTADLVYSETFDGSPSDFTRYRRAVWGNGAETMLDVVGSLPAGPDGHGQAFRYVSPVTDVLGLVLEAAAGRRYPDLLADRLLCPLGLTGPVLTQVDRQGRARATGGISMPPADLARIGMCLLAGGRGPDGRQVIPANWIDDMRHNGDRDTWRRGDCPEILPGGAYRSLWYAGSDDAFFALGIFGQVLWCDPTNRRVIVRTSSRSVASDPSLTIDELAVMRSLTEQDWECTGSGSGSG